MDETEKNEMNKTILSNYDKKIDNLHKEIMNLDNNHNESLFLIKYQIT